MSKRTWGLVLASFISMVLTCTFIVFVVLDQISYLNVGIAFVLFIFSFYLSIQAGISMLPLFPEASINGGSRR